MVFLPDTPHNIFKDAMGSWSAWRDGAPIEPRPPTQNLQDQYACEIRFDFKSRDGNNIQYEKGMQGLCLYESDLKGRRMARILIQGVTQHGSEPGQQNAWVPLEYIKRGPRWSHDIKDWNLDISTLPQNFRLSAIPQTGTNKLEQTVTALLQAIADTPATFMATFTELASRHGINAISSVILQGISEAGVGNILAQDDCNYREMYYTGSCHIDDGRGQGRGIYARFQKSLPEVKHWKPNTRYAYVGKTEDSFSARFRSHPHTTTKYGMLNKNSEDLKSFALCRLHDVPSSLFFVAEQILLCLMGTYRADILTAIEAGHTGTTKRRIADIEAASYFVKVSSEVFQKTGFSPALKRPSFGITEGANCRSPIEEMGLLSDKMLYLRTDFTFRDHKTKTSVPMAEFRRHIPRIATRGNEGGQCKLFEVTAQEPFERVQTIYLMTPEGEADGIRYPTEGTPCQVVVEVRLDGKAHEHSWARLPYVSIFENSEQANSFAIRVEWQESKGSKTWRYRYIQFDKGLWLMEDEDVSGSLRRYARAIGMLHWFFNVDPVYTEEWIPKPRSSMRVLQVSYDHMTQTIRFLPPTKSYNMKTTTRNSARHIRYQLQARKIYQRFEKKGNKGRYACDLCYLLKHSRTAAQCTVDEGETVCNHCQGYGLPFCPWTPSLRTTVGYFETDKATLEERALYKHVRKTLFDTPPSDTSGKTFEQVLYPLIAEDDMDDDDDVPEESDSDS